MLTSFFVSFSSISRKMLTLISSFLMFHDIQTEERLHIHMKIISKSLSGILWHHAVQLSETARRRSAETAACCLRYFYFHIYGIHYLLHWFGMAWLEHWLIFFECQWSSNLIETWTKVLIFCRNNWVQMWIGRENSTFFYLKENIKE